MSRVFRVLAYLLFAFFVASIVLHEHAVIPPGLGFLALILSVPCYMVYDAQCPSCGRLWTKSFMRKDFPKRPSGLRGFFSASKERITYRCGSCGYQWKVISSISD